MRPRRRYVTAIDTSAELLDQLRAGGLTHGGVFKTTFRDYASAIVPGVVRIIPVRSA